MKLTVRKKYLFYILAFTSAIISASMSGLDAIISAVFIKDPWAFGLSAFLVGIVVTLGLLLFFSLPAKGKTLGARVVDPSFRGIRLVRRSEIPGHIGAGFGNAVMTLSYFLLISLLNDPSAVLPFAQITILYLVVIESVTEKNVPTLVEIESSLIVTFGAILASLSLDAGLNLEALLVVFLLYNPAWVLFSIYQRRLKLLRVDDHPNDSMNIRFWNLVFSGIFSLIMIVAIDMLLGSSHVVDGLIASVEHFGVLAVTMGVTFFAMAFYIRALGIGKASVTQAVRSSSVLFSIPVSMLIAYFGFIDPLTSDPTGVLIKTIGIVLVMLGIISFALHMVKAYVFVRVRTGFDIEQTMKKIWNIRGVSRVAAVAGRYDFIVEIRTRTLVKGYEKIVRRLEDIPGIEKCRWESVLKEWEEI